MGRKFSSTTQTEAMNSIGKAIGRQLSYIFHDNKSRVKELEECNKNLCVARDHVRQQYGTRINDHLKGWLEKVDEMINEIEKILHDEKRVYRSLFPKHQLSRRAVEIKDDVDQLLQSFKTIKESKKSFGSGNEIIDMIMNVMRDLAVRMNGTYKLNDQKNRILVKQISKRKDDVIPENYQSFDSRNRTLEKIIEALKDPRAKTIGIYGHGGMGKTTLATQVARRVEEEKLFDKVYMISVSRNSDTKKIQSQIAHEMRIKLEEKNVIGRAQILTNSLCAQEKSLVILDDLWDDINLGNVLDHSFENVLTFTILLISRSKLLLSEYVWKHYMFPVGKLEEKEAKTLLRKVGGVVESQDYAFESLVDKFAIKTCALSPDLILSIGSCLRGKSCCQWKIALEMLQDIKFTEFALEDMQCPYINWRLMRTFLLCAQMGHHPLIIDFVKYHGSLNFVFLASSTIHNLISNMKLNLLLDNYSGDHVIMRDEVRDFALSEARNRYNFFTMRNGKLEKWPKRDELKNCTAIFLHSSVIINELPEGIRCPQLEVFHLDSNNPFLKLPENFFRGMSKLLVLELFGLQLPVLPSSISCLKDLRMLSLKRCMLCDNLSIIGELECLKILSLSGSEIESLPNEWGKLKNLQFFDISNCPKLKVIPANVLSSLYLLRHFYARNSLIQWWVEGQENYQSLNASHRWLDNLEIDCPDVAALPTNALFDKLKRYKVVIGNSDTLPLETIKNLNDNAVSKFLAMEILNDDALSKSLAVLQLKEGTNAPEKIKNMFKNVENLLLGDKLNGIGNVFRDMNLKEFSYLKHFSIVNNLDIQYIINSDDMLEAFPKLESLCLIKLPNMKKIICCNQLTNNSFGNLKTMKIQNCARLKNLFSISLTRLFAKLETIEVSECQSMEEIVGSERQENNIKEVDIFPKLKEFHLVCMERLRTIWHSQGGPGSYSMLDSVVIEECKSLVTIFPDHMMGRLSLLAKLKIVNCPLVEEIFDSKDITLLDEAKVSIFPKLEELHLIGMERLTSIWHSQCDPHSYNMLDSVVIEECPKLVTVFPNHMIGRISLLVRLKVVNCQSVQEIFDIKDTPQSNVAEKETCLRFVHIEALPKLERIWNKDPKGILSFKYLKKLWVSKCPNLKSLIPISIANVLQYSESLTLRDCNSIKEIVSRE